MTHIFHWQKLFRGTSADKINSRNNNILLVELDLPIEFCWLSCTGQHSGILQPANCVPVQLDHMALLVRLLQGKQDSEPFLKLTTIHITITPLFMNKRTSGTDTVTSLARNANCYSC